METKVSIISNSPLLKSNGEKIRTFSPTSLGDFERESHFFDSILIESSLFNPNDEWIYLFDNEKKIYLYTPSEKEIIFKHYLTDESITIPISDLNESKLLKNFSRKVGKKVISSSSIPKILHLMWIDERDVKTTSSTKEVVPEKETSSSEKEGLPLGYFPEKYNASVKSIVSNHPDFEIKFWDYSTIRTHISENFGKEYLQSFDSYKLISKCDFARMCVVYSFGGVYCDLDFYFRESVSTLFGKEKVLLWREPSEHQFYRHPLICNGIFGAERESSFILGWIEQMKNNSTLLLRDRVLISTGPEGLGKFYTSLSRDRRPKLGNVCNTLPFTKIKTLSRECIDCEKEGSNEIVAYTTWDEGTGWEKKNITPMEIHRNLVLTQPKKMDTSLIVGIIIVSIIILVITAVVVYYYLKNKKSAPPQV